MEPDQMKRWLLGQTGLHPANPSGKPRDSRSAMLWHRDEVLNDQLADSKNRPDQTHPEGEA